MITPLTTPALASIVATEVFALLHTPPVVASANVVVMPVDTVVLPVIAGTTGSGFTMIINVSGTPVHVLVDGVMITIPVSGVVVVFVTVKDGMLLPVPLAPRPIVVLLLVQANVVLGTVLL